MADNRKEWEKFYELSEELLDAQPWETFDDGQLFCIHYDEAEEDIFVNILGNAGRTYGLVFYKGLSALNDYVLARNSEDLNLPGEYAMFHQNCLTIYFGDEDELPDDQYEAYTALKPDFSHSEQGIPYAISMETGYFPWSPTDQELTDLNRWLRMFLDVYPYGLPVDSWGIGAPHGICVCDITDEDEDEWTFDYPLFPLSDYSAEITLPSVSDVSAILKTALQTDAEYEIDIYYAKMHINDPAYHRPCAAPFILVAETKSGMIVAQDLIEPAEEISLAMNEVLLQAVTTSGIPRRIHVRSVIYADMIEDTAGQMGSEVVLEDTLPAIDEALVMLDEYITATSGQMMS